MTDRYRELARRATEYCIQEGRNEAWLWEDKFAEYVANAVEAEMKSVIQHEIDCVDAADAEAKMWKAKYDSLVADANRYEWLRANNARCIMVQEQKHGYRSTAPDAQRETWYEDAGWTVNTLSLWAEFATMDEAVDAAMKAKNE